VANAKATADAETAATKAAVAPNAALAAAVASFNTTHSTTPITVDEIKGTATIDVAGVATPVITINSSGALVLAKDIVETDAKYAGVTSVLNASIAETASDKAVAAAHAAAVAAKLQVNILDKATEGVGEAAALINVGKAFTIVKPPVDTDGTTAIAPTAAQVSTEYLGLFQTKVSAEAAAAAAPDDAAKATAATNAAKALSDFELVLKSYTDVNVDSVATAQGTAATNVTTAEKAISDLADLVAKATDAGADATQLTALNNAIKTATAAFADNKLTAPVVLDGITAATAGSDVYLAGTKAATIISFGALGKDYLYVGKDFTLNTTGKLDSGDDTKLEVFFVTKGTDTVVTLETKAFGSHSADAEIEITLTGVAASQLTLNADGIITLA
jgi:hypothetical protein